MPPDHTFNSDPAMQGMLKALSAYAPPPLSQQRWNKIAVSLNAELDDIIAARQRFSLAELWQSFGQRVRDVFSPFVYRPVLSGAILSAVLVAALVFYFQSLDHTVAPHTQVTGSKPLPGKVIALRGQAYRLLPKTAQRQRLQKNMPVRTGETVQTGANTQIAIKLVKETKVIFLPNTRVTMQAINKKTIALHLKKGQLLAAVQSGAQKQFLVVTPNLTVQVTGTKFSVQTRQRKNIGQQTVVYVQEGKVRLLTQAGSRALSAGQKIAFSKQFTQLMPNKKDSRDFTLFRDLLLPAPLKPQAQTSVKPKTMPLLKTNKQQAAQPAQRAGLNPLYGKGIRLMDQGKYLPAARSLKQFVKKHSQDPNVEDAYFFLGSIYCHNINNEKQAIRYWQIYLKNYPVGHWLEEVSFQLGQLHQLRKAYQQAVAAFENYIINFPSGYKRTEALYALATLYRNQQKDYGRAINHYQQFLNEYPTAVRAADALYWLAHTYQQTDKHEQARVAYQQYIKNFPVGKWSGDVKERLSELEN